MLNEIKEIVNALCKPKKAIPIKKNDKSQIVEESGPLSVLVPIICFGKYIKANTVTSRKYSYPYNKLIKYCEKKEHSIKSPEVFIKTKISGYSKEDIKDIAVKTKFYLSNFDSSRKDVYSFEYSKTQDYYVKEKILLMKSKNTNIINFKTLNDCLTQAHSAMVWAPDLLESRFKDYFDAIFRNERLKVLYDLGKNLNRDELSKHFTNLNDKRLILPNLEKKFQAADMGFFRYCSFKEKVFLKIFLEINKGLYHDDNISVPAILEEIKFVKESDLKEGDEVEFNDILKQLKNIFDIVHVSDELLNQCLNGLEQSHYCYDACNVDVKKLVDKQKVFIKFYKLEDVGFWLGDVINKLNKNGNSEIQPFELLNLVIGGYSVIDRIDPYHKLNFLFHNVRQFILENNVFNSDRGRDIKRDVLFLLNDVESCIWDAYYETNRIEIDKIVASVNRDFKDNSRQNSWIKKEFFNSFFINKNISFLMRLELAKNNRLELFLQETFAFFNNFSFVGQKNAYLGKNQDIRKFYNFFDEDELKSLLKDVRLPLCELIDDCRNFLGNSDEISIKAQRLRVAMVENLFGHCSYSDFQAWSAEFITFFLSQKAECISAEGNIFNDKNQLDDNAVKFFKYFYFKSQQEDKSFINLVNNDFKIYRESLQQIDDGPELIAVLDNLLLNNFSSLTASKTFFSDVIRIFATPNGEVNIYRLDLVCDLYVFIENLFFRYLLMCLVVDQFLEIVIDKELYKREMPVCSVDDIVQLIVDDSNDNKKLLFLEKLLIPISYAGFSFTKSYLDEGMPNLQELTVKNVAAAVIPRASVGLLIGAASGFSWNTPKVLFPLKKYPSYTLAMAGGLIVDQVMSSLVDEAEFSTLNIISNIFMVSQLLLTLCHEHDMSSSIRSWLPFYYFMMFGLNNILQIGAVDRFLGISEQSSLGIVHSLEDEFTNNDGIESSGDKSSVGDAVTGCLYVLAMSQVALMLNHNFRFQNVSKFNPFDHLIFQQRDIRNNVESKRESLSAVPLVVYGVASCLFVADVVEHPEINYFINFGLLHYFTSNIQSSFYDHLGMVTVCGIGVGYGPMVGSSLSFFEFTTKSPIRTFEFSAFKNISYETTKDVFTQMTTSLTDDIMCFFTRKSIVTPEKISKHKTYKESVKNFVASDELRWFSQSAIAQYVNKESISFEEIQAIMLKEFVKAFNRFIQNEKFSGHQPVPFSVESDGVEKLIGDKVVSTCIDNVRKFSQQVTKVSFFQDSSYSLDIKAYKSLIVKTLNIGKHDIKFYPILELVIAAVETTASLLVNLGGVPTILYKNMIKNIRKDLLSLVGDEQFFDKKCERLFEKKELFKTGEYDMLKNHFTTEQDDYFNLNDELVRFLSRLFIKSEGIYDVLEYLLNYGAPVGVLTRIGNGKIFNVVKANLETLPKKGHQNYENYFLTNYAFAAKPYKDSRAKRENGKALACPFGFSRTGFSLNLANRRMCPGRYDVLNKLMYAFMRFSLDNKYPIWVFKEAEVDQLLLETLDYSENISQSFGRSANYNVKFKSVE